MNSFLDTSRTNSEDEERFNFYFSPFRKDRSINPHSWDNKMKFWNDAVLNYCSNNKTLVFNSKTLPDKLSRNCRSPQCLDVVINDLLKKGTIQRYSDFVSSCNSSWLSWSFNYMVKKPLKWSYSTFVSGTVSRAYKWMFGSDDDYNMNLYSNKPMQLPDEEFIVLDLVKQVAKVIYERHNESVMYDITDNIIEYDVLQKQSADICNDARSFEAAILELCKQKLCFVKVNTDGGKIIMMTTTNKSKSIMSGNEIKIYELKTSQVKVENEIKKIEKQIEECRQTAKLCLQQNNKKAALKQLRKKKLLEDFKQKKEHTIDKIEEFLHAIQQTESQKYVLDAYSSGVQAFKGLREKAGLTEDRVDDTMADIQEAFDSAEEINQTISRPIVDLDDISQEDLEAELNDILAKVDMDLPDILDLPSVPTHEPQLSPQKVPDRKRTSMRN